MNELHPTTSNKYPILHRFRMANIANICNTMSSKIRLNQPAKREIWPYSLSKT